MQDTIKQTTNKEEYACYWKEWMCEDNGHLQPPATTQLVGLQALVLVWKESPPTGVQGVRKGFEAGLSKQQISNVFTTEEALHAANVSPFTAIDTFSGARSGKILMLLDDCFLGKQNKAEAYYTRGRHNNCDTINIAENYFRLPRHTVRENSIFIILFPQGVKNLTQPC